MTDRHLYTNRLIKEKSLYLLQHSHNPVDWYAWGEEAFLAAKELNRPIFLSIGYSTCHWCHVMEKESFENEKVAELMNEYFINIKVDREELPEIDGLYMEFAQSMMSGATGWPLNIILTPELRPFFAATYLPTYSSHGLMGLLDLIQRIKTVWESDEREKVILQSEMIVDVFSQNVHTRGEQIPDKEMINDTVDLLFKLADSTYGGMRGAPKFPIAYQYNMLMRYISLHKDSRALFVVEKTLDMMHRGGIYDHLGGGFSRYSVDRQWLVPHFEKMLYDNALIALCYLEGWLMMQRPLYRKVCKEVIDYILRDMTHSGGGFYSAEDADSEGREGWFYTWPYEEVKQLLGDNCSSFCSFYQITPSGNFEGRSILNTPLSIEEFAAQTGDEASELEKLFSHQRHVLWKARELRIHPLKDDKVLSSWNGLMITALVEAGLAFSEPHYVDSGEKAARFINNQLTQGGFLLRRWRDGEALHSAGLEEYAFMIKGYLSLFEAGRGSEWLRYAIDFTRILKEKFKSPEGAFYQTDGENPHLILRKCQFSDGAEPSGNAVHCENLLKLYHITEAEEYLIQAEDIFKGVDELINNYAQGYCYHFMNLIRYYDSNAPLIVIALNKERSNIKEISTLIFNRYIPHKSVVWIESDDTVLTTYAPELAVHVPIKGKTTLYICYHGVCKQPVSELADMQKVILNI